MQPIAIGPYQFIALPERALYWPAQQMLLLADLHLGKADTFRHHGIGIPQAMQHQDLERLQQALCKTTPQRCLVLGDLVHGHIVSADTCAAWNALVHAHPSVQFELVEGNHDRAFQADKLLLHAVHPLCWLQGICLSHEPLARADWPADMPLNIHGHIHPAMRVPGTRKKTPALVHAPPYLNLPAFSEFTAGVLPSRDSQSVWVFAEDEQLVIQIQ